MQEEALDQQLLEGTSLQARRRRRSGHHEADQQGWGRRTAEPGLAVPRTEVARAFLLPACCGTCLSAILPLTPLSSSVAAATESTGAPEDRGPWAQPGTPGMASQGGPGEVSDGHTTAHLGGAGRVGQGGALHV